MIKRYVLSLFISCLSLIAFCEDVEKSININYLRTPEAAAFKKYGEESVNEYTGTADISFPLYTIKCKDIEIPLVLRYDASGIKVEQDASWVGLGWNLMVGGCINYVCAGGHDMYGCSNVVQNRVWTEYLTSEIGWSHDLPSSLANMRQYRNLKKYYNYNANEDSNWMGKYPLRDSYFVESYEDDIRYYGMNDYLYWGYGERDFYSVNVMGKSFMFFVDPATLKIFNIGKAKEEFVVTPDFSKRDTDPGVGNIPDVGKWKITDSDGYIYYFGEIKEDDELKYVKDQLRERFTTYTSCWYLTEMYSPTGEYVKFTYSELKKSPRQTYVKSCKAPFEHNGGLGCCGKTCDAIKGCGSSPDTQINNGNMEMTTHYLSEISTRHQTVTFVTSNDCTCSGKRLDAIKVKSYDGTTIKTINLSYGTFAPSNVGGNYAPNDKSITSQYRLKLNNVKEIASGETLTTSFSYNENVQLPSKRSCAQDYWGYYNGKQNSTLLPTPDRFMSSVNQEETIKKLRNFCRHAYNGANRNSDGDCMQAAILNKIVYPTGGSTKYEYEPNRISTSLAVGGLRVKKISNYDNDGVRINYIEYNYAEGVLLDNIETIDFIRYYNSQPEGGHPGPHPIEVYTITSGHSSMPAFFASCNPGIVGYGKVTKSKFNAKGNLERKIVTSYRNNRPENWHNIYCYRFFDNGVMTNQEIYDASNSIVSKTSNEYYNTPLAHYATNMMATYKYYPYTNYGWAYVKRYPYILSRVDLTKTITTEYCPNGSTIITTKRYSYNDKNHQVSQIDEFRSKTEKDARDGISLTNQIQRIKLKYTVDDEKYKRVVYNHNALNYVVETQNILVDNGKENSVSTKRTDYNISTYVFSLPISSSTSVGNAPLETRVTYTYDGRGNIRSVTIDGKETVYIWSYNDLYPIAKIEGIKFDDLKVALFNPETSPVSFEEIDPKYHDNIKRDLGLAEINKMTSETNTSKINTNIATIRKKVNELGGIITTYTYKPLVGMTSATLPNGLTTRYEYDAFGRLSKVIDHNGVVVSANEYNYKK